MENQKSLEHFTGTVPTPELPTKADLRRCLAVSVAASVVPSPVLVKPPPFGRLQRTVVAARGTATCITVIQTLTGTVSANDSGARFVSSRINRQFDFSAILNTKITKGIEIRLT